MSSRDTRHPETAACPAGGMAPMLPMFALDQADVTAICAAMDTSGELAAAAELQRRFPADARAERGRDDRITDTTTADPPPAGDALPGDEAPADRRRRQSGSTRQIGMPSWLGAKAVGAASASSWPCLMLALSHDPSARVPRSKGQSHEPRTYKPLILIGFQSHDPGTVTAGVSLSPLHGTHQTPCRPLQALSSGSCDSRSRNARPLTGCRAALIIQGTVTSAQCKWDTAKRAAKRAAGTLGGEGRDDRNADAHDGRRQVMR